MNRTRLRYNQLSKSILGDVMIEFYPKLLAVSVIEGHRLSTRWHTGETLEVDVTSLTDLLVIPPREDQVVVTDSGNISYGHSGAWMEGEKELFSSDVYALAQEQAGKVSHAMLVDWQQRNLLTKRSIATFLGIKDDDVMAYLSAKTTIPQVVWLACLGWESSQSIAFKKPDDKIITLKVSDDGVWQDLMKFVHDHSPEQIVRLTGYKGDMPTDTDQAFWTNRPNQPIWSWQDLSKTISPRSPNRPELSQFIPDEEVKKIKLQLNNLLFELAKLDNYSGINQQKVESYQDAIGIVERYRNTLKQLYVDEGFGRTNDYRNLLVELVSKAPELTSQDLSKEALDNLSEKGIIETTKIILAASCYLLDHHYDYFYAWLGIAKTQRMLGMYFGLMIKVQDYVDSDRRRAPLVKAYNKLQDKVTGCVFFALDRKFNPIEWPYRNQRDQHNQPSVYNLRADNEFFESVKLCFKAHFPDHLLSDDSLRLKMDIVLEGAEVKKYLKQKGKSVKDGTSDTNQRIVQAKKSITFEDKYELERYIYLRITQELFRKYDYSEFERKVFFAGCSKTDCPRQQRTKSLLEQSLNDIERYVMSPLTGLLKKK